MPLVMVTNPHATLETAPDVVVNGKHFPIRYGVPLDLPEEAVEALQNSTFTVDVLLGETDVSFVLTDVESDVSDEHIDAFVSPASPEAGNGDAGAAADPGGEAGGASDTPPADDFDPEAVILGTVDEVADRLATLTRDQLDAVARAELDREQPRSGVAKAIEHARKAFEA